MTTSEDKNSKQLSNSNIIAAVIVGICTIIAALIGTGVIPNPFGQTQGQTTEIAGTWIGIINSADGNFHTEAVYSIESDCKSRERSCIGRGISAIRVGEKLDRDFLLYFLRFYEPELAKAGTGSTFAAIAREDLETIKVPLPPLTEQKRIASLLASADRLRQLRRTAHDLGDVLLQSMFLEMFGNVRTNDKKWELARFEDVCPSRLGKMLDEKRQTGKHKRPYLRNFNVQWFRLDLSDVAEMDFDEKDRKEFRLEYGDVLICEGGEVGRATIWRNEIEECYFQKALHRARPNPKITNPEYIVHLLWWMAKSGGLGDFTSQVTIAHLTGEKLKELVIAIPPLSLQEEFGGVVRRVESLRGRMTESERQVDGLFERLLAESFG